MVKAPANGEILMLSIKVTWGLLSNGHGHRKPGQSLELATDITLASCNLSVVSPVLHTIALIGFSNRFVLFVFSPNVRALA